MSTAGAGGLPEDDGEAHFEAEVVRDVRIPVRAGELTLAADLWLPRSDLPVPVLVVLQPYRKDFVGGAAYEPPARWFAERGYATLLVDLLGTGSSDGLRRPEFDDGEGDDGVDAVVWAAVQPWCDGNVGMWGISYAAVVTLRTAARRPAPLRAIVVLDHGADPERDTVHPDGCRGDFHALVARGASMLASQLLPPIGCTDDLTEQRRWQRRLRDGEPVFVDFVRHPPGDPVWRERAIDCSAIEAPALCVSGWRDAFPHALIAAWQSMGGPKQLIVGPWGHVMPQDSGLFPIDFLPVMLAWWRRFLAGDGTAIGDAHPVTLFLEGLEQPWRSFPCWPPSSDTLELASGCGADTTDEADRASGCAAGWYEPDATVGALRGLPGLGLGELCQPPDQRADDERCLTLTGPPLGADLVVVGAPSVVVRIADGSPAPRRLIARLCALEGGASELVTSGALRCDGRSRLLLLTLRPTAKLVRAGRRLQLAIGDADFPRLTPLARPSRFEVASLRLVVPVAPPGCGEPVELATALFEDRSPARASQLSWWTVRRERDPDSVEVEVVNESPRVVNGAGHGYSQRAQLFARVERSAPSAALMRARHEISCSGPSGGEIAVQVEVSSTGNRLVANGGVSIGTSLRFDRSWTLEIGEPGEGEADEPTPGERP